MKLASSLNLANELSGLSSKEASSADPVNIDQRNNLLIQRLEKQKEKTSRLLQKSKAKHTEMILSPLFQSYHFSNWALLSLWFYFSFCFVFCFVYHLIPKNNKYFYLFKLYLINFYLLNNFLSLIILKYEWLNDKTKNIIIVIFVMEFLSQIYSIIKK